MKKPLFLGASLLVLLPMAAAEHGDGGMHPGDWWLLAFTLVVIGGLAAYIYYRVQEAGIFTFIPHTAMEDE